MKKKTRHFMKKIIYTIQQPEMAILPGQLAFFFVLSMVPIISLIGIVGSFFSISVASVIDFLNTSFAVNISDSMTTFFLGRGFDLQLGFFLLGTFLIASNGARSIIITSNILYNIPSQYEVKLRIKAIFLTLMLIFLIIFVLIAFAFGGYILQMLRDINVSRTTINNLYYLYRILRWPLTFFVIYFNIKLIYTFAPDKRIKSKDVTYGAVFTAVMWITTTSVFSYYVVHFAKYDVFYGSLSNIIAIMFWIYLLCYVFVLGMALNANKKELEVKFNKKLS